MYRTKNTHTPRVMSVQNRGLTRIKEKGKDFHNNLQQKKMFTTSFMGVLLGHEQKNLLVSLKV